MATKITNQTEIEKGLMLKAIAIREQNGNNFIVGNCYRVEDTNNSIIYNPGIKLKNSWYARWELENCFEIVDSVDDIENWKYKALILKETYEQIKINDDNESRDIEYIKEAINFLVEDKEFKGNEDELNFICTDMDITMVGKCSCCGDIIMPDDELYSDSLNNDEPLCDHCSVMNEKTDMYERYIQKDIIEKFTGYHFSPNLNNVNDKIEEFNSWLKPYSNRFKLNNIEENTSIFNHFMNEHTEWNICYCCKMIENSNELIWRRDDVDDWFDDKNYEAVCQGCFVENINSKNDKNTQYKVGDFVYVPVDKIEGTKEIEFLEDLEGCILEIVEITDEYKDETLPTYKCKFVNEDKIVLKDGLYFPFVDADLSIFEPLNSEEIDGSKNMTSFEQFMEDYYVRSIGNTCFSYPDIPLRDKIVFIKAILEDLQSQIKQSTNKGENNQQTEVINKNSQESIDISNISVLAFSTEQKIADYIKRCEEYLSNKLIHTKYKVKIYETEDIYGERKNEEDSSDEYLGLPMYEGKIIYFDEELQEQEIENSLTRRYCEISAVFDDLDSFIDCNEDIQEEIDKNAEYNNLIYENKKMGEFIGKLGFTPDDITSYIINGSNEQVNKSIKKVKSLEEIRVRNNISQKVLDILTGSLGFSDTYFMHDSDCQRIFIEIGNDEEDEEFKDGYITLKEILKVDSLDKAFTVSY